jgi:hypothetical protein
LFALFIATVCFWAASKNVRYVVAAVAAVALVVAAEIQGLGFGNEEG